MGNPMTHEQGNAALSPAPQPSECPKCGSPDPKKHPAVQFEGEVQICDHAFHTPQPDKQFDGEWPAQSSVAASEVPASDPASHSESGRGQPSPAPQPDAVQADDALLHKALINSSRHDYDIASPPPADDVVERAAEWLFRYDHQNDPTKWWGNCGPLSKGGYRESARKFLAANLLRQSVPVDREKLTIESGKFYIDGHGDMCGPMEERTPGVWINQHGAIYSADGTQFNHVPESLGNLYRPALPASAPVEAAGMPREAIEQLTNHQEQCDFDGVMVKVSRQALDEVLEYVRALPIPESPTDAAGDRS